MPSLEASWHPAVVDLIGNTPLLRFSGLEPHPRVQVYAKAEWKNPGGSSKDRAAARMLAEGARAGALRPGLTILDATSGNTGIAYAMLGAAQGYPVLLCVPGNVGAGRRRVLTAYGARLVVTDAMEGSDGAIRTARVLYERDPDRYFYPDQYNNSANWRAHYDTTGSEIWRQTAGRVTHFVAGLGTTGTFTGIGRRLKKLNPDVTLVSVQPDSPLHGIEGLKHMPTAIVPGIYDPALADEEITIATEDAHRMVRRMAAEQGLLIGVSGGAALVAAERVAAGLLAGTVVTVIPDGGERYLTEPFWEEQVR